MPRTLIVATTSYAGMGPYVSEIVNNFAATDDVFYFFRDYEDNYFQKNVKLDLHSKCVFFKRKNSKWNKLRTLLPIKSAEHNLILSICKERSIKLVHFINNPGDAKLVCALKKIGVASVSTVHDLHPHESNKAWYKELRFKIIYARLHDNLILGENLITNSKAQYDELALNYPTKHLFFHPFPSLVTHQIANGVEKSVELLQSNKPYILFFGRIEEYKGISLLYDVFVENLDLSEKYNLVIAGSGTLPFARSSNERNVIVINRYINDSEVAELYKNASVVVYPYISATQSGVLSLAFYFGIPTLASDVPFFKDIIAESGAGLLFKKNDKADLKDKLDLLLKIDTKEICLKEYEYYRANYSSDVIRSKLLNIYERCV